MSFPSTSSPSIALDLKIKVLVLFLISNDLIAMAPLPILFDHACLRTAIPKRGFVVGYDYVYGKFLKVNERLKHHV